MIKNKSLYMTIFVVFLMVAFALNTKKYSAVTLDGLTLWALSIAPSVFFYFVLSTMLSSLGVISKISSYSTKVTLPLFNCDGLSLYAFIMSLISGYPTGSKVTAELYQNGLVNEGDAIRMSGLSSVSGGLFILSTVGGMIGINSAVPLLFSHILSVILTAQFFRGKRGKTPPRTPYFTSNTDNIIYNSVYDSVISVTVLGGIITVFYVLTEILFDFHILDIFLYGTTEILHDEQLSKAIITGFFESIKGVKLLSEAQHPLALSFIGSTISFGGLSVITQSLIFLKRAKIKTAVFLLSKVIQAVICFIILYIFTFLSSL